jgi:hypothetical protein
MISISSMRGSRFPCLSQGHLTASLGRCGAKAGTVMPPWCSASDPEGRADLTLGLDDPRHPIAKLRKRHCQPGVEFFVGPVRHQTSLGVVIEHPEKEARGALKIGPHRDDGLVRCVAERQLGSNSARGRTDVGYDHITGAKRLHIATKH